VSIQEADTANKAHLPAPPTELIGREAVVHQLGNRLLGHIGRLLTLVGPPGIGKTTLALAVAARLQLHYRDGAVFVPLAAISDPVLMVSTIAAAVGCREGSARPPQVRLIEFLRRKTMLLVLDNLEQIPDAAPLIAELVAECPGLCILATSRERLHLRAEQRFKVPPLDLASAVDLFIRRAQAVDAAFVLTSANQPTLEAICQRLDCLPLAIELGAAQVDLLSLSHLLAQLQAHRLDLLVDGAHDLPPQHRTLRLAIERSYGLLPEAERRLFRRLGVFVGGFDWAAI
jgi:predicted ATPase